jgi:hypothetical protein
MKQKLYNIGWLFFWTIAFFPIAIIHLYIILYRIREELELIRRLRK